MTVWKYRLNVTDEQTLMLPKGALVRHVGVQDGALCLWVEVDPSASTVGRCFRVIGTGNPMPAVAMHFLGSVQMPPFVWHVYEEQS